MYIPYIPEISKPLLIQVAWCCGNAMNLRLGDSNFCHVIGEHCRGFSGISRTP